MAAEALTVVQTLAFVLGEDALISSKSVRSSLRDYAVHLATRLKSIRGEGASRYLSPSGCGFFRDGTGP
jgi:hypothetical protein